MAQFASFTRVETVSGQQINAVRRFQRLVLWLMDLPKKGVHVGGGQHTPIADTCPDPPPSGHPGWTTRWIEWIAHPANVAGPLATANAQNASDRFAIRIDALLAAAWQAKKSQLTAAQRNWVQSHVDSAAELAAEWMVGGSLAENADIDPEPGGAP
jgi:hypothetical protein